MLLRPSSYGFDYPTTFEVFSASGWPSVSTPETDYGTLFATPWAPRRGVEDVPLPDPRRQEPPDQVDWEEYWIRARQDSTVSVPEDLSHRYIPDPTGASGPSGKADTLRCSPCSVSSVAASPHPLTAAVSSGRFPGRCLLTRQGRRRACGCIVRPRVVSLSQR